MRASGAVLPFPVDGLVFDYRLVEDNTDNDSGAAALAAPETVAWEHWTNKDTLTYVFDLTCPVPRLIVPTLEMVC